MTVEKLFERAGGRAAVAHTLGLTVYAISLWETLKQVPDEYVERVARLAGVDPKKVNAPETRGRPRTRPIKNPYEDLAYLYNAMTRVAKLTIKGAARLHGVTHEELYQWRQGLEAPPVRVVNEIYDYVAGVPLSEPLTMEDAIRLTGLTQSKICDLLRISRPMGTVWKNKGLIPAVYSTQLKRWALDNRRLD
jgi:hypothetical protein